jgi:hypothetical protein
MFYIILSLRNKLSALSHSIFPASSQFTGNPGHSFKDQQSCLEEPKARLLICQGFSAGGTIKLILVRFFIINKGEKNEQIVNCVNFNDCHSKCSDNRTNLGI